MRRWAGAGRVRRCPGPRPGVPVAAGGSTSATSTRRHEMRLEAIGPLPAGRRHRRRRRRRPLRVATASGSSARPTSTIARPPWYHEPVELTTFCSGFGPCWAERRTIITGEHGALVDSRRACGSSSTVAAGVRSRSTSTSTRIYGEAARRAPGPRSPRARPAVRPTRRAPVAAARQRLRRARPREQCAVARGDRGRARPLPARAIVPTRARVEYRGTARTGRRRSSWPSAVQCGGNECGARDVARRSTARCGSRRPSPSDPEPGLNRAVTYTDRALDPMPVEPFAGRRCLVTGGLGFIGSNLALALARGGARRHRDRRARRRATVPTPPTWSPTAGASPSPTFASRWSRPTSPTSTGPTSATPRSVPTSCSTSPGR